MCSYASPISLFPPLELLSISSLLLEKGIEIQFIDAVAEKINIEETTSKIRQFHPDILISLTGIESIHQDMETFCSIKEGLEDTFTIIFGHFPSIFPDEVLAKYDISAIILGEPENAIQNIIEDWQNALDWRNNPSLYTKANRIPRETRVYRQSNIKELPISAYQLLNINAYYEPFMPRPFSMIQTSRGCPYQCNYCIKSYGFGNKWTLRSAEQIVEEIQFLIEAHRIKSFRIIDDTFTVHKQRVIDFCKLLLEKKIRIQWTCLSRTDNLSREILMWMKKAGCIRIYFGLESGSQRILNFYEKDIDIKDAKDKLLQAKAEGIQTTGFFMLGLPNEEESDFKATIDFAISSRLSLAAIEGLSLYPGTKLYDLYKDEIEFNLFPYTNEFKDPGIKILHEERKSIFYKKFYLRPSFLKNRFLYDYKNIGSILHTLNKSLTNKVWNPENMPGIKNM